MKLYAELSKSEKQPDGSLHVWGYASAASADSVGETVTAEAMKAALPDYMKWGNVREMHQLSAVGTALEATVQEDGRTYFGAHVVDPVAVKKVESGVYKGFSIGGKVTSRDLLKKTTVTGIRLNEISLVDRPCHPEAEITLFKVDDPKADVDDLIGAGRHELSGERSTWRNGYRDRALDPRLGTLNLKIPKLRTRAYFPGFLEPRKTAEKALVSVIQEAWIAGVSTRRVDEPVQAMGMNGISKSSVSKPCKASTSA